MNSRGAAVVVAGVGAQTALGSSAPASAAAVRAGISLFTEHPFLFDENGDEYLVAQTDYLEIDLRGAARLAELTGPAVAESLAPITAVSGGVPAIPVYLGLPAKRPGRSPDAAKAVIERVQTEIDRTQLQPGMVKFVETGHCAGTMAIQAAWRAVRSGEVEIALAGGVESYLETETMAWLAENDQVHGANANPWGFVPGEAAGFALLVSERVAHRLEDPPMLEVLTAATARETMLIKTGAICLGAGLTNLFKSLAAELAPDTQADRLLCDMNGEPYRADEFGFATGRSGAMFRDPSAFETPAISWGDVGAATGPLLIALADAAARKGYGPGPLTAAFTSAESGERCGFVVRDRGTI